MSHKIGQIRQMSHKIGQIGQKLKQSYLLHFAISFSFRITDRIPSVALDGHLLLVVVIHGLFLTHK